MFTIFQKVAWPLCEYVNTTETEAVSSLLLNSQKNGTVKIFLFLSCPQFPLFSYSVASLAAVSIIQDQRDCQALVENINSTSAKLRAWMLSDQVLSVLCFADEMFFLKLTMTQDYGIW